MADSAISSLTQETSILNSAADAGGVPTVPSRPRYRWSYSQTPEVTFRKALKYEQMGDGDEAMHWYARMIELWPQEIAPYHRLSIMALERKDPRQALAWIAKGLAINEAIPELWNNRALALTDLKEYEEAEKAYRRAIELRPQNWEAYYNFGRMCLLQKNFAEAEPLLRRAVELDPQSATAVNNFGLALRGLYRFDEAALAFDRAVELQPNYLEARFNKGAALYAAQRFDEAEVQLRETIRMNPYEAGPHYNLASVLLCQGRLLEGFEEYEWRWKTDNWPPMRNYNTRGQWQGEPLDNQTLFVWHEQGIGDTIQFYRLVMEIAKSNCEIEVEVQPELHRLFVASNSFPNVRFHRFGERIPVFDLHVPMLSLPRLLKLQYETFPTFKPYLRARGFELDEWRRKLKSLTPEKNRKKKRVGIVWAGNPKHPADGERSMSWEQFRPIVDQNKSKFQFFNLMLDSETGHPAVIDLGSHLKDFAVTAAIVSNLDLVIAVDTSIVHLAGALGKRVWTLLAHTADWRWVVGEERTKWYPSMTLFWQKKDGAWEDVIGEVNETLALE